MTRVSIVAKEAASAAMERSSSSADAGVQTIVFSSASRTIVLGEERRPSLRERLGTQRVVQGNHRAVDSPQAVLREDGSGTVLHKVTDGANLRRKGVRNVRACRRNASPCRPSRITGRTSPGRARRRR